MRIVSVLALALVPALCLAGGAVKDFSREIPKQVRDWKASGPDAAYDRKTLYDYMDGGAEVYLAYDFREVFVRKYADPEGNELALDIYDMGSSAEAFGMFSFDRQDPDAGIGQGSEYGLGLLRFWRGRYFVSVTVSGNEEKAEAAVLELGKAVAPLLGPDGDPPDMVKLLPPAGLLAKKTAYFHNHVHLSNRYFVSSENILGLDERTECLFAEYGAGTGDSGRLIVVRYPSADQATAAVSAFMKAFLPGAEAGVDAMAGSRGWTAVRRRNNVLAVVFEGSSKEYAGRLAEMALRPPQ